MEYGHGPDRARCCAGLAPPCPPRGNRLESVFFEADDYCLYRRLSGAARPHSSLGPLPDAQSRPPDCDTGGRGWIARDLAQAHRRHTGAINARFQWTGHLFQGRFGAVVMGERDLLPAARYIALNQVVAGSVSRAEDWP